MVYREQMTHQKQCTQYYIHSVEKLDDHIFVFYCWARVKKIAQINRNMVVLRHNKRHLTLVNPVKLEDESEQRLLQLGKIQRIIRLSARNGIYHDKYYLEKFPHVSRWAPSQDEEIPVHRVLDEQDDAILPNCHVFTFQQTASPECALLLLQDYVGNLLVTSDALQSHRDNPCINMVVRTKLAAQGMMQSRVVVPQTWLSIMSPRKSNKEAIRNEFESLLRLDFERLVSSSGIMLHQGAKEEVVMAVEKAFPQW